MKIVDKVKNDLKTDVTWNRVARLGAKGARALPSATAEYLLDKLPIIGWLPRYEYRWIFNDITAGLTVGLMLIPQGLSYAKIATIPVQYGLMSSWLPSAIYAFMGTTKDLSTGPTSLIGLLTSDIVKSYQHEYTPSQIASAVAFMMGVYGMVLGFLKLGFLLEFISLPILSGFISAVAITIGLNQMGSLLGEPNVSSDGTAKQIHDIFAQLPQANGYACAVGFTGILFLTVLDHAYKRWPRYRVLWLLSVTRSFLCLVLFTGVGYAVNHRRGGSDNFLFDVAKVQANGQEAPRVPPTDLLAKVAGRSIAVFIGSTVEHTAIARAFGVHNRYVTDQSQELAYYGVTNLANSFFHAMGVGGAMSRTAVNSACNVKSPLSGLVTTAVVLVSIFKLVGTLYWIPKATLSAIIICAIWPLIAPPRVFYGYWKASLADFVSSMIAFWVSLFVSTELGIACSVGFNIVYIVLRQTFTRVRSWSSRDPASSTASELAISIERARLRSPQHHLPPPPPEVRVFRLGDSLFFSNAYAVRTAILDAVQTHHSPHHAGAHSTERQRPHWSVVGERRVARLRKKAGIAAGAAANLPGLRVLILDFGRVNHLDATGVTHLKGMVDELRRYAGEGVEVRFVGMSGYVRERFERMKWKIVADGEEAQGAAARTDGEDDADDGNDDMPPFRLFYDLTSALAAPYWMPADADMDVEKLKRLNSDAVTTAHAENA